MTAQAISLAQYRAMRRIYLRYVRHAATTSAERKKTQRQMAALRRAPRMTVFQEAASFSRALGAARGSIVGISCKAGQFAVTETVGRKTVYLTGWQSHAECLAHLRAMVAA